MKRVNESNFNWRKMQSKAHEVLGDDFWSDINQVMPRTGPCVDIYKTSGKTVVLVEVPGISSLEKINIKLRGFKLLIYGNIPSKYPVSEDDVIIKERFTGEFKREINLPHTISPNGQAKAKFTNGLIEIHIPNSEEQDEKEIFFDLD